MADGLLYKLRAENASLINELRDGVLKLQLFVDNEKETLLSEADSEKNIKRLKSSTNTKFHVRTPLSLMVHNRLTADHVDDKKDAQATARCRKSKRSVTGKHRTKDMAITSTPLVSRRMLESEGNLRPRSSRKAPDNSPSVTVRTQVLAENCKPKSILIAPDKRKTPKHRRPKVFFPSNYIDTKHYSIDSHRSFGDKSLLGYDWIAGILDNENNEHVGDSERLIEEINEFRRVNRDECTSTRPILDSSVAEKKFTYAKTADISTEIQKDSNGDFCCGSTYTVDSRLLPVPIHGPYSQCPVCLTKPAPESEYSESYIRVSVPRSSLKSPYRLKPHRRKSFDPSDSVALSEHCLAGWQCACPAYPHGRMDSMDIKSSIDTFKKLPPTENTDLRASYQSSANEFLNTSVGMRYGLQLLEDAENLNRRVNPTSN